MSTPEYSIEKDKSFDVTEEFIKLMKSTPVKSLKDTTNSEWYNLRNKRKDNGLTDLFPWMPPLS